MDTAGEFVDGLKEGCDSVQGRLTRGCKGNGRTTREKSEGIEIKVN